MSWIKDIEDVKSSTILIFIDILMFIIPGVAINYHFNRNLFIQLDDFKLVLLSIVFVLPIFLLLLFPCILVSERSERKLRPRKKPRKKVGHSIIPAISTDLVVTNLILYLFLLIAIKNHWNINSYIAWAVVAALVFGIPPFTGLAKEFYIHQNANFPKFPYRKKR